MDYEAVFDRRDQFQYPIKVGYIRVEVVSGHPQVGLFAASPRPNETVLNSVLLEEW